MRTTVLQHNKCYLINWFIKYWTVKVIIKLRVKLGAIKSKSLKLWLSWGWVWGLTKETKAGALLYRVNHSKVMVSNFGTVAIRDGLRWNESRLTPRFHISADPGAGGPKHSICPFAAASSFLWKSQETQQLYIFMYSVLNTRAWNKEAPVSIKYSACCISAHFLCKKWIEFGMRPLKVAYTFDFPISHLWIEKGAV